MSFASTVRTRRPVVGSQRPAAFTVFSGAVAVMLLGLSLYPLLRLIARVLVVDGEIQSGVVTNAWTQPQLGRVLLNTLLVVAMSSTLALVLGSTMAFLNERTDARWGAFTDVLPLTPFLVPPIAGAIGWVLLMSPRSGYLNVVTRGVMSALGFEVEQGPRASGPFDIFSWYGMVLVYTIYMVPFVFLLVSSALRMFDGSLEEQSRMCGAGPIRTMFHTVLPSLKPALGAAMLLLVWYGLALYALPAAIGPQAGIEVLSVRIVDLIRRSYPPQIDAAVGLSVFVFAVLVLAVQAHRRLLRGGHHATIGGKGQGARRLELGVWRWPARLFLLGYVFVTGALPIIAMLVVALNGYWTSSIDLGNLSLRGFRNLFNDKLTANSIRNSLLLAIAGASIGMLFAALLALHARRHRGALLGRMASWAVKLPATVSGLVLAVGFLVAFSGPPFHLDGTLVILLLAYVIFFMPQASVAADSAVEQVGSELAEASAVSGAASGRTFRSVMIPLMVPGLTAGWAMLFVFMLSDLTSSVLLAGPRNPVLGLRILDTFESGTWAQVSALVALLSVISSLMIGIVFVLSRRSSRFGIDGPGVL